MLVLLFVCYVTALGAEVVLLHLFMKKFGVDVPKIAQEVIDGIIKDICKG